MLRLPLILGALLLTALLFACGGSPDDDDDAVTIEPLPSTSPAAAIPTGGKPAAPSLAATPTAEPTLTEAPPPAPPSQDPTVAPPPVEPATAPAPQPTPTQRASDGSTQPTLGRWIGVNVTTYTVSLMDGVTTIESIGPVGVGTDIDTGDYVSTQTGLFHVHTMIEGLAYDAPYDTYISHWIGFDAAKANGFHSFLKDENGAVVDPSTGRVSNGCIRTGNPEAIFAFAEIGMPVWVHW